MAAFQGIELLGNFSGIFTFLFVFAVTYGVLQLTGLFKDSGKTLHPIIAVSLAVLVLFSQRIVRVIEYAAPWFVIFMISIMFIIIILKFLGVPDEAFEAFFARGKGAPRQQTTVIYWTLVIVGIIMALGISQEFGQDAGPYLGDQENVSTTTQLGGTTIVTGDTGTGDFQQNFGATIFHPKVLGAVIILIFASFAIRQIAKVD